MLFWCTLLLQTFFKTLQCWRICQWWLIFIVYLFIYSTIFSFVFKVKTSLKNLSIYVITFELLKELTEEWTGKWREAQAILREQRALGLRKAGPGVVLDSDRPHLVAIDDDPLTTGVTLYHLKVVCKLNGEVFCYLNYRNFFRKEKPQLEQKMLRRNKILNWKVLVWNPNIAL